MSTPGARQRILVIDDNVAIHEDYKKILTSAPDNSEALDQMNVELFGEGEASPTTAMYELDFAVQGRQGLKLVTEANASGRPYAMAFIDVKMPPGWDGIETTAQIWQVCPELPVVICTAYSDYSWDDIVAKLGHTDRLVILKKPFENVEVQQLAYAMANKSKAPQTSRGLLTNIRVMTTTNLQDANEKLRIEFERRNRARNVSAETPYNI